jgi:hypothetical protein
MSLIYHLYSAKFFPDVMIHHLHHPGMPALILGFLAPSNSYCARVPRATRRSTSTLASTLTTSLLSNPNFHLPLFHPSWNGEDTSPPPRRIPGFAPMSEEPTDIVVTFDIASPRAYDEADCYQKDNPFSAFPQGMVTSSWVTSAYPRLICGDVGK